MTVNRVGTTFDYSSSRDDISVSSPRFEILKIKLLLLSKGLRALFYTTDPI